MSESGHFPDGKSVQVVQRIVNRLLHAFGNAKGFVNLTVTCSNCLLQISQNFCGPMDFDKLI